MRIALVASSYRPSIGGVQAVVHMLARGLQAHGHTVLVITNRYPKGLPRHEVIDGISVDRLQFLYPRLVHLKTWRLDLFIAGLLFLPVTTCRLLFIMLRFKTDIVNLHYVGSPSLFLWLIHSFWRFPWLVSLHGGDVYGEPSKNRFNLYLFRAVVSSAGRVSACSNYLLHGAIALSPGIKRKSVVIQNGVDIDLFANATPFRRDRPYLFAVGQLESHKGFDLLIQSFAGLAEKYRAIDLLIGGDGSQRSALERSIEREDLRSRIELLGSLSHDRIASLMRGSMAVVIPSRSESFGIVALEARAAGRPIVAAKIGGLLEALEGASVVWVREATVEELKRSIKEVLEQEHFQVRTTSSGEDGYVRAHSWSNIVKSYIDSYTLVARENRIH